MSDGGAPRIGRERLPVAVDARDRAEQADRVRHARRVEDVVDRARLDDGAGVHHQHLVDHAGDDAEVVGDEHDGGAGARP